MKKILLTTLLVLSAFMASAQSKGTITASIVDADTGDNIAGAVIELTPQVSPDKKQYFTSAYKGAVSIPSVGYGDYKFMVSFLGYNNLEIDIKVSAAKLALGVLKLKPGVQIETVVKEAKALRTSQKGDTVSYNAGSFKVVADADVEGLLKKMPGLTISDGKVEAQGEEVKKIFVDGKEFFGDDVSTAIKSLPAQAVDRVEVYNKLSDAAEFSGMDDGEGFKAINIVTHSNMRQGQFGKFYAGYGYDFDNQTSPRSKYLVGGNANIFHNDHRVTLLALFNNVNQQNFSFEDILGVSGKQSMGQRGRNPYMVRSQSGVARVNAIGLNYSGVWGKRDQVKFEGSYFFNNTNTVNSSSLDRWNTLPVIDTLSTRGNSSTLGNNHRLNARIEWKISENQNLLIRPGFSYQLNDPFSNTMGWRYGNNKDGMPNYSRTQSGSDGLRNGYNFRTGVTYRAKLGKAGRSLTVDGFVRLSNNQNNTSSYSNLMGDKSELPEGDNGPWGWDTTGYTRLRYLRNIAPSRQYNLQGEMTYTEPVSKYSQLSLQYRISYEDQERDKNSYITGGDYAIGGLTPDPSLSNSFQSGYFVQRVGPGFRYAKERNTFIANVFFQRSMLDGSVVQSNTDKIRRSYNDFTYFMMGQLNINRENSLRLFVSSYTNNPDVNELQSIYDLSDVQSISRGNPNLNPTYNHRINLHYTNSNIEKGRTFMFSFSLNAAQDFVASHIVKYPGQLNIGGQSYSPNTYTLPINMSGYWNTRAGVDYGFPIGFIKSNLNLRAGVSYSSIPSMLEGVVNPDTGVITDGIRNDASSMGYDAGVVLGSNISENVDFTLAWNGAYSETKNSYEGNNQKNRDFSHTAQANMKFVLPLGFTITASAAYNQYLGFTNNYDQSYLLCNLWFGKKVFKNKRGEVMVGVNDLLNQNRSFSRTTGSGWTQNSFNSVLGRYYMVQFTYNLRRFGKKGSTNLRDYDGVAQPSGSRRSGAGATHPPMGRPAF